MISYFIFKNINSRQFGIHLEGVAPIQRAEEKITSVDIPGRSGSLTLTEGDDVYANCLQNVNIRVPASQVTAVLKWLRGEGYVTFSNDIEHKQTARVVKAITLEKASPLLDWYIGEVVFQVHPLKESVRTETAQTVEDGDSIMNVGAVIAKPVFTVDAGNTDFSITVNDYTLVVSASLHDTLNAGEQWQVDCDSQEVELIDEDGEIVELCTQYSTGSFPVLGAGNNAITLTGVQSVEMLPRWRYI